MITWDSSRRICRYYFVLKRTSQIWNSRNQSGVANANSFKFWSCIVLWFTFVVRTAADKLTLFLRLLIHFTYTTYRMKLNWDISKDSYNRRMQGIVENFNYSVDRNDVVWLGCNRPRSWEDCGKAVSSKLWSSTVTRSRIRLDTVHKIDSFCVWQCLHPLKPF